MATSNFQTQKPFPFLLSITLTFFLLLLNHANSIQTTSFSFDPFEEEEKNLNIQGGAVLSPPLLRLTEVGDSGDPVHHTVGQVNYVAPIRIWDKEEGTMLDFVTKFNFVINASNKATTTGDGLAFFLAPESSSQPPASGGLFGLFEDPNSNQSNQIVAVEFDTYRNDWDPCARAHIGIDLHSVISEKNGTWDFVKGQEAHVEIRYQASTQLLTAILSYVSDSESSYSANATVDLKIYLPEWVYVGLSATTGDYAETHDILNWSFESSISNSNHEAFLKKRPLSKKRQHGSM